LRRLAEGGQLALAERYFVGPIVPGDKKIKRYDYDVALVETDAHVTLIGFV
jgi:hypothetical protein